MELGRALSQAAELLRTQSVPNPHRDAELLLQHALGRNRAYLLAHPELVLSCRELSRYHELLNRRAQGKPIQYITGHQEFWGLDLIVTSDVLIPRPETEHLVEAALGLLRAGAVPAGSPVVDVGTGSGAIALALANALPGLPILACDISEAALAVARTNALRLCPANRIEFVAGDLLMPFFHDRAGSVGMVVSNPPYVADNDESVETQVRDYEPHRAVFAGPTGNEVYRCLIPQAAQVLAPLGWLLLEIGAQNEPEVLNLLRDWKQIEVKPDLRGIPRVVIAQNAAI